MLIIKFFGENDPIKDVYHNYAELQRTLGGTGDYQSALRYFELTIFEAMGVQPTLNTTADTLASVSDSKTYFFKPSIGILENNPEGDALRVHGETLCLLTKKAGLNGRAGKEAKMLAQALADPSKAMSACIFAGLRAADKFTTLHGRSPGPCTDPAPLRIQKVG